VDSGTAITMGPVQWALLGVLGTLWGFSFFFQAICLETLPVLTTVFGRVALAGVTLLALAFVMRERFPFDRKSLTEFAVLGLLRAALPMLCIVWAQTRIDSNVAGILNSTSVIFTAIVAHVLTTDDRLSRAKVLGITIGVLGIVVMIGFDALRGLGDNVLGQLMMLVATLSYGFAAVYGRRFKGTSHVVSAAGMLLAGALMVLPFAWLLEWPLSQAPSLRSLGALAAVALLSTALAFVVWFRLIQSAGPSNTSMVTLIVPFVSLALGATLLGEEVTGAKLIGLALILLGLVITQQRFPRRSA